MPSACVLFLLGLIPGMPNTLFLLGSAITFSVWWIIRKNNKSFDNSDAKITENNTDNKNTENEEDDNIILEGTEVVTPEPETSES